MLQFALSQNSTWSTSTKASFTPSVSADYWCSHRWIRFCLILRTVAGICFGFCLFFLSASSVSSASVRSTVKIILSEPDLARVHIKLPQPLGNWSFLNAYGPTIGLGERVRKFIGLSENDQPASTRKVSVGVFRTDPAVTTVLYEVYLAGSNAAPHTSIATSDYTLLMLADLLPQDLLEASNGVDVSFELPDGWTIQSAFQPNGPAHFSINDPGRAVFLAGPRLRRQSKAVEGMKLELSIADDWPFKEEKVLDAAARVLKKYLRLTQFKLPQPSVVFIASLPSISAEKWKAEARGSTVVLLLNKTPPHRNWIGQLEIIFTHELLHLWVPNSLTLHGSYDWFFEGFTLYQALGTALDLKLIKFDEYLNTLGRVYDSYLTQADTLSLVEASEQRWTKGPYSVYDKAMLVAFLYDLERRHETNAQQGLSDGYAELFRRYTTKSSEGNAAIMSVLKSSAATENLLQSYVINGQRLNLAQALERYGLLLESDGRQTKLKIASKLTKAQLLVLRSLGYRR